MNRLLLSLIFLTSFVVTHTAAYSQTGYLFVKKGSKKKRTYTEGENIYLRLQNDSLYYGMITRFMNDTIFVSGRPIPRRAVKEVIVSIKTKKAFVIGYGPLLIGYLNSKISLKRKKFRIGKKFHLQVLDFYLPRKRAF